MDAQVIGGLIILFGTCYGAVWLGVSLLDKATKPLQQKLKPQRMHRRF